MADHKQHRPPQERIITIDLTPLPFDKGPALMADTLLSAAERHSDFAAIVRMPEATEWPRGGRGVRERIALLKTLRPRLKAQCAGLAFLLSVESQRANAKQIRAGARMWGCPTFATDDADEADRWAREQLEAAFGRDNT